MNTSLIRMNTTHLKYRADIDGLRAIAVLSVVAYHAFPTKILGGFIGVDIFFIISGFLISTILLQNLESRNYSIIDFYRRRVKRIFPALLLVLISCLVMGWFLLLSDEYRQLGKHIAGGAGFISNILLWRESGYFDASAESKPLLHLWSLAVEEQFYIFWPLILAATWKKRWSFLVIAVLAALSFIINLFYLDGNATSAFYSPLSRFWELMIGSMLAYISLYRRKLIEKHKDIQSLAGFALIAAGLTLINHTRQFPGWWALLPTLGASLIISAGPSAYLNRKILSSKPFVWFGLISYPLYLWHWPIFSFMHIVVSAVPTRNMKIMAIALSILLAWLTYRLLEKPLRTSAAANGRMVALVLLMLITGSGGFYCYANGGLEGTGYRLAGRNEFSKHFDNSYPDWNYINAHGIAAKNREECNFYDISKFLAGQDTQIPRAALPNSCFQRDPKYAKSVFLWGDSHAGHLNYGLRNNLPSDWQILQIASSSCAPAVDVKGPSATDYCQQSNWFAIQALRNARPDVLIISQNLGQSVANFDLLANQLKGIGIPRIIFTGPVPHWDQDLPRIILRRLWENTPQRTFVGINKEVLIDDKILKQNFKGSTSVLFADLISPFCNADGCLTYLGSDRIAGLTSADYGHLTPIASDYLAKKVLAKMVTEGR